MVSNCFYCKTPIAATDAIPVAIGAGVAYMCVACDDKYYEYSVES